MEKPKRVILGINGPDDPEVARLEENGPAVEFRKEGEPLTVPELVEHMHKSGGDMLRGMFVSREEPVCVVLCKGATAFKLLEWYEGVSGQVESQLAVLNTDSGGDPPVTH